MGTNTSYILAGMKAADPTIYDWNWPTDNLALPIFFQIGALGTAWFFGGILLFLRAVWPRTRQGKHEMVGLLAVMGMMGLAGGPWEHYYQLATYGLVLGMITWRELGYGHGFGVGALLAGR